MFQHLLINILRSNHFDHLNHTDYPINPQPPPAYYTIHPRTTPNNTNTTNTAPRPAQPQAQQAVAGSSKSKHAPSLIDRYNLQDRVSVSSGTETPEEVAAKSSTWEVEPEKREAMLRERKAQMILAARQ